MSSLTKVRITLKDPQGRVLAKHPFIVKLLHADIVGVTTVDKPVFSQTGLNGTVILELKPSDYIYSLEYSIRGQRVPAILKFKVPVSTDIINIEDIYIDTNYETNDVLALVNELKAIKATVLQMVQEHPVLVTRVNHVANALDNLVSTVTNQGDGIDEILTRLSALDMATDSLIAITDDLVRDKADKYLFTELSTKLDNEVTRITGLINNIVTDLQADKLDLANFKLYIAAKFASIDTDLFKIKTDIVGLKTGQIDKGVFKKAITDELTVKWQNDIKGYDNDVQASLTDIRNVVATADSALAERISTTSAKVDNNTAEIVEVRKSYVTKDEAVAFVGDSLRAEWQGDAADMIDKLQIGGRNLIKQSEVMRGVSTVAPDIIPAYNIETGELSRITVYTLSGFVRVTDNVKGVTVGFKNVIDDAQSRISSNLTTVDNEWVFFKYTFATGATTNHKGYIVVNHLGSTDTDLATVETKLMKLEIGVKATDWSPAITDIDDKITVVTAQLDDFKIAQANKDGAMTQRIENAESSVNDNKASIKSIEETYAKASEVGAISKSALEATWKGDIDNAVTAVTIGGKNYLDDGMFDKGYWQFYSDNNQVTGKADGFKLSIDSTTNVATGEWFLSSLKSKTLGNIQSNKVHTISFTGYGDSAFGFLLVTVILRSKQNGVFVDKAKVMFNVEDINNRYVRQFNTGNLINSEELQLVFQVKSQIGTLWLNEIQLEIGNKVSDWTLAPSDYLEEIKETKASLEEFKRVSASANEALAKRVTIAESQIGVTSGKITTVESTVSNLSNTVTTMNTTMDSGFKNSTAQYNSLANTVTANQSSTVTSLNSLSTRIDNINPDLVVKSTITNGSTLDHANGNVVGNSPGWSYVEFMDVYEKVSYIFRATRLSASNFNLRVVWYNESKQFISSEIHAVFEGAKTIQAPARASYLRIAYGTTAAKFAITEIAASAAAAVSADLAEFKQSQATQNGAFANAITKNTTAIGNNTSTLNTFANTYATKDAVGGLAKTALQSTWQADAQAKVDALYVGGRNLLKLSDRPISNTGYHLTTYFLTDTTLVQGEKVTLTIWGDLSPNATHFMLYNSGGFVQLVTGIKTKVNGVYTATFTWITAPNNNYVNLYAAPNSIKGSPTVVTKVMLERGSVSSGWSPALVDVSTVTTKNTSDITTVSKTVSDNAKTTADSLTSMSSTITANHTVVLDKISGYTEAGVAVIPNPVGGVYSGGEGTYAGAIQVILPMPPGASMMKFTVDIYNYALNTSNSYEIAGYCYNTTTSWLQTTATCTGSAARAVPVRFGIAANGNACIWIGELTTTWSYVKVVVRNVFVSYGKIDHKLWNTGWEVKLATAFDAVHATLQPFNGEKAASDVSATLDTYKTTQAAVDSAQTLEINAAKSSAANAMAAITVTNATVASQGRAIASMGTTITAVANSGGDNLLEDGNFLHDMKYWNPWGTATRTFFTNSYGERFIQLQDSTTGMFRGISQRVTNFQPNEDITISFTGYSGIDNGGVQILIHQRGDGNNDPQISTYIPMLKNSRARYSYTFKSSDLRSKKEFIVMIGMRHGVAGNIVLTNIQMEYGSVATLFKPSVEALTRKANATWSVTTEAVAGNKQAVAGISLGVDAISQQSEFIVKANKFLIADAAGATKAAFINDGLNPELVLDGSLSATKVRIGIGANLIPDPLFETGLTGAWRPWLAVANISLLPRASAMISASCPATRVIRYSTGSTATSVSMFSHTEHYQSEPGGIPVVAGEQYKVSLDFVRSVSPASAGRLCVVAYFYTQTGGTASVNAINILFSSFTAGVWVLGTNGSFTVPAAAVKMRLYVYAESMTGTFEWCNPAIMKMVDGSLVVNGSITANEIAAKAIGAQHLTVGCVTTEKLMASIGITSPVINGGTVTGTTLIGGNINIGSGVFTVDSQGNVKLTKGQINIANNFIVDANGNMTAKSGVFGGSVSADSIDTPVSQTYFADVGSYTSVFPPSKHLRKMYITTFSVSVIVPPSWDHDTRGEYTMDIKIYYKSPAGVETLLDRFGCRSSAFPQAEQYTTYNSPITRTIPNYEVDVPLEGGSYKVDVYTKWKFENSTYTNANTTLGQDECLRTTERTGTRIGHISRRLMQYNLYRKV